MSEAEQPGLPTAIPPSGAPVADSPLPSPTVETATPAQPDPDAPLFQPPRMDHVNLGRGPERTRRLTRE